MITHYVQHITRCLGSSLRFLPLGICGTQIISGALKRFQIAIVVECCEPTLEHLDVCSILQLVQ
jgi:hypothetical protein